ncbi:MAG: HD domain-containing protein [Candidatus Omnitrophica bacterium]|nr:HD domain-containing protein [Candidatus Omnitrophota bacterium]
MKKTIKVLAIEDDPFFVAVFKHYGEKMKDFRLDVNHVVSLQDSLDFLDEHSEIDLIFLDYRVHSKITGLEILQHIRAKGVKAPIIVVTGSGNEEIAVLMMKAGASDYLVKGDLTADVIENSIKESLEHKMHLENIFAENKDEVLKNMAIKTSLNAVCIIDLGGFIIDSNLSFSKFWGYSEEEVLGKNIQNFFNEPEECKKTLEALKLSKSWLGEVVGKRKDDTTFFLQALFSLLEDGSGVRIMGSFLDITKIKEEEEKREQLYQGIMEVFALRAEAVGNVETAGHIRRIAAYTRFLAEQLRKIDVFKNEIDSKYISDLSYASMLHDVGKWRTPNEILLKPDQLTPAEWEIIKQHPRLGVEMLTPLLRDKGDNQYLKLIEDVVLYHHERWDGSGYPEGLKGELIPLSARIVALSDMYDALTSERSYRKALGHQEAVDIIKQEGEKLDPCILRVFLEHHLEFEKIRDQIS